MKTHEVSTKSLARALTTALRSNQRQARFIQVATGWLVLEVSA